MQDNKLSIDTGSDTTGVGPIEDGRVTRTFERDLPQDTPQMADDFHSIRRNKRYDLDEFGREYYQVMADAVSVTPESRERFADASNRYQDNSMDTNNITASSQIDRQPEVTSQARSRVPLSTSSGRNTTHSTACSTTSTARARQAVTSSEAVLAMQIQLRLIQVIKLLTEPNVTPATRAQARTQARAALRFAVDNNASFPLTARCSFYIAHATYNPKDNRTTPEAVNWFERATEAAEADYPEGQWAQEWLDRYESLKIDPRPSSSSSWISNISNNVWNAVFRNNSSAGGLDPPPTPEPRPGPLWRLYSNGSTWLSRASPINNGRIPSFTTVDTGEGTTPTSARLITPTSANSGTSSGTQDHHGLKWSPGHPFGKGEVLPGRNFELLLSPDPIYEDENESDEEEQHIPANVLGGLVETSALSPIMQRPYSQRQRPAYYRRSSSDYYVPPAPPAPQKWRIANLTSSPKSSPTSPSTRDSSASASFPTASTATSTSLPPQLYNFPTTTTSPPNPKRHHSRAQSVSLPDTPTPFSPTWPTPKPAKPTSKSASVPTQNHASIKGSSSTSNSNSSDIFPSRNRNRLSISHAFIRATGLDVQRTRGEAARMEEGESPGFGPRREEQEVGFYVRRRREGSGNSGSEGKGDVAGLELGEGCEV